MADIIDQLAAFLDETGADTSAPGLASRPLREMIDSVDMVAFLAFIEETFGVAIDNDAVTPETFRDLASVAGFVKRLIADTAPPSGSSGAPRRQDIEVRRIPFDVLKQYWIEVDHFRNPDKKIREVVRVLGPYECTIEDPRRESYGLFQGDDLIGVTHLVQWDDRWLRYRTLNIRESHQGPEDLGWILLRRAIDQDWRDWKADGRYLFGWIRRHHVPWSLAHGFEQIGDTWHGEHIGMSRRLWDL